MKAVALRALSVVAFTAIEVGCGPPPLYNATTGVVFGDPASALRASGVHDLPCPIDQIHVDEPTGFHPTVAGCGWIVEYKGEYHDRVSSGLFYRLRSRSALAPSGQAP